MALLSFFIILLLVALPLGSFSRVTLGLTISFSLLDVVVITGSVLWVANQIRFKKFPVSLIAKSFLLVIGIFIVSLLVNALSLSSAQFFTSALYIIRFACFGTLYFMVQGSSAYVKQKLNTLLIASGTLLLVGGYAQYYFYPSLRNLIYFGWDEHFYRMFGTFFDPNFFGLFLVLFFLYTIAQIFRLKIRDRKLAFAFYFCLSTAIFIAIFLTYSRTTLLALFCGIIILFWNKHFWKWIMLALFGVGLSILLAFSLTPHDTQINSLFRATSTEARIGSARDALIIFRDNPIIGIGFNAYRYAMYRHNFQSGSSIQEDHGASGADSSLLLVLATSGIVGLVAYIFFLSTHMRRLILSKKKEGLALFVALFVGSFFVNGLFYPSLLVWLWIVLGTTESA